MRTAATTPGYAHTQKAPLCLILYGSAGGLLRPRLHIGETPGIYTGGGVDLLIALLGQCFHHLTVEDRGDVLAVRFGPVPLFRRTVRYADKADTLAEAMAALEKGLAEYLEREGIE